MGVFATRDRDVPRRLEVRVSEVRLASDVEQAPEEAVGLAQREDEDLLEGGVTEDAEAAVLVARLRVAVVARGAERL